MHATANGSAAFAEARGRGAIPRFLLVMAAAVTWGTTAATMVLVGRRSPLSAGAGGFLRLVVAAPILLALARSGGGLGARRLRPHLGRLALIGASQAAFQIGYFGAVPRIGVGPTALLVGGRLTLPGSPRATAAGAGLALGQPDLLSAARPVWAHMVYLGLIPTAVASALYIRGLRSTTATAAGIGSLLEPLTATLLGMAAFGESLGGAGLLGAGLLLGAVALLFFGNQPRP